MRLGIWSGWVGERRESLPKNAYVPGSQQDEEKPKEKKSADEPDPTMYTVRCAVRNPP